MNLREALIVQNPSLELQRAAQAELAQASNTIAIYKDRFGPLTQELA